MPLTSWLVGRWHRQRSPPMRIHERLFLNPFEKWARHGRFPMAFFLHVVLLVLVSIQVLYYVARDVDHIWRTTRHLSSLFLGIREGKLTISRPTDMQSALSNMVVTYFDINNVSLVHYEFLNPDVLDVHISFRNTTDKHIQLMRDHFKEPGYLQEAMPFMYDTQLQMVEMISITCGFLEKVPEGQFWITYAWSLNLEFDGKVIGEFWGSLRSKVGTVGGPAYGMVIKDIINSAVLILAIICVGLTSKKVCRSCRIGLAMRRRIAVARAEAVQSGDGSITEVAVLPSWAALFSSWWMVSITSHALQIAASLTCLWHLDDLTRRFALLGWSCFFTWMSICQYFEFFPAYYTTFSTTQNGLISICKYMISVMPIFTAFMFLGMCLFWKEKSFRSPSVSYASLFSMLNGDSIRATFADIYEGGGWMSTLYLYLFIFIFTYIVLNVNITIIQESFLAAKTETPVSQASMAPPSAWPSSLDDRHLDIISGDVSLQDWTAAGGALVLGTGSLCATPNSAPATPERNGLATQATAAAAIVAGENPSSIEHPLRTSSSQVPTSSELSRAPAWRGSQEPLLHTTDALDPEMAAGSRARRRSTSPSASASFPMIGAKRLASESSCRRMSPRFRNARLQQTLAVAFPEDLASDQQHADAGRGTSPELQEEIWSMDMGARPADAAASTAAASSNMSLLMVTLPLLTHALRTMTQPPSEEVGDTDSWHELEQMLREHSEATSAALARLHLANDERDAKI